MDIENPSIFRSREVGRDDSTPVTTRRCSSSAPTSTHEVRRSAAQRASAGNTYAPGKSRPRLQRGEEGTVSPVLSLPMPSVTPSAASLAAFLAMRSAFLAACAAFFACLAASFSLTMSTRGVGEGVSWARPSRAQPGCAASPPSSLWPVVPRHPVGACPLNWHARRAHRPT
eukprot:scaffold2608_cov362-Prasinococcus_capsulatus_cf.AAC.1